MLAFDEFLRIGGLDRVPPAEISLSGADPVLPARHPIGAAAAVALALGGAAAAELVALRSGRLGGVHVDVGAATATLLGFALQTAPGRDLMRRQPATTRLVRSRDGRFVHLHGGFPHLHEGTLALLGCGASAEAVDAAVSAWSAAELEEALAEARLCGAVVRSRAEWEAHPQGRALRALPIVRWRRVGDAPVEPLPGGDAPLAGVRVLDLTRVLAGPTCGRTLAQYGADVLRIASPRLPSIAPFVVDTGHGKRSAFVDLETADGRAQLAALVRGADVFVDGYRPGSLARRGLDCESLAEARPGLVHVSLCCYGHAGPWAGRAGWEQLAQSATGIAAREGGADAPKLLPAAATDYTTGYLAAYGALEALRRRATEGGSWSVEVSLARTAMWLQDLGSDLDPATASGLPPLDAISITSDTAFGRITHLGPVVRLSTARVGWRLPTAPLGHHAPTWLPRDAPPLEPQPPGRPTSRPA